MTLGQLSAKQKVQYAHMLAIMTVFGFLVLFLTLWVLSQVSETAQYGGVAMVFIGTVLWRYQVWPAMLYTYVTGKEELRTGKRDGDV